jgi:hypothetical protein
MPRRLAFFSMTTFVTPTNGFIMATAPRKSPGSSTMRMRYARPAGVRRAQDRHPGGVACTPHPITEPFDPGTIEDFGKKFRVTFLLHEGRKNPTHTS